MLYTYVFPPLQGGMDDSAGFPGDALEEADTLEVTVASAACADCGDLRYSLRRDDLQSFCLEFTSRFASFGSGETFQLLPSSPF